MNSFLVKSIAITLLLIAAVGSFSAGAARAEVDGASVAQGRHVVRFHVQVRGSGTAVERGSSLLARRAPQERVLEDEVAAVGGTVEAFVGVDGLLRRRFDAGSPAVRASLERLSRWYVVELPSDRAAAWQLSAAGEAAIERIEMRTPIEAVRAFEVSDPEVSRQQEWAFELIDLERAWDEVRAEDGDVIAAVVDGGFDVVHPDLAPNLWVNEGEIPGNDLDDDGNGYVDDVHGFNETTRDGDVLYLEGMPETRRHGTLVAGTLGAVTDNGMYGAGVAYNPRLMLVSVQDESGEGLDTTYAYRGITYAALNGASVINCSWRGIWFRRPGDDNQDSAPFRQFENDVVEAATALGALVVAAAGNDNRTDLVTGPSHYPDVLSVTATNDRSNPWQLWQNSNAGPWVDIAAPGDGIFVILPDEGTARVSGTSLAAPMVSAAAVLIKTKWPGWTPEQIRARLRATARDFSATEPIEDRKDGAGRGMVQVGAAVTAPVIPALSIRDVRFVADDQSEIFAPGDDVAVAFEAQSLFPYDGPVTIRLETDDPFLVPFETTLFLSQVVQGAPLSVRRGLELKLRDTAPRGHVALVHLIVEAGSNVDRQSFYVDAVPYQFEARSGELELSVSMNGKLGYSDYNRPLASSGVGFRRTGEAISSLFFGSLLIGTGPDQVLDAVQAFLPLPGVQDFRPRTAEGLPPLEFAAGADGWTTLTVRSRSAPRSDGLSVRFDQRVFAHESGPRADFLLTEWAVTPTAVDVRLADPNGNWENVHLGLLMDWTASGAGEVVFTDPVSRTQWAAPPDGVADGRWVGARWLGPDHTSRAAHFDAVGPREGGTVAYMIDLDDLGRAMSDSMLWSVLEPDARDATAREGNVVGVLGAGPYPPVPVGSTATMVVALSIASSREELFDALDRARVAWTSLREGRDGTPAPSLRVLQNVPNPFNPRTEVRFALPERGPVAVELFDARGRRVHRLVDGVLEAGYHRVEWDGRDASGAPVASGVYFVRVRTATAEKSGRLVLVR